MYLKHTESEIVDFYKSRCGSDVANAIAAFLVYKENTSAAFAPSFSEDAIKILEKRYFLKDDEGVPFEDGELLLCRIAVGVQSWKMRGEEDYDISEILNIAVEYYKMMADLDFLPGSPTIMNAGILESQMSACFVIPVKDDIDGIFGAITDVAKVHKSGGGTGMDFSRLRPEGSAVRSTGGVASGPISFMKIFDAATEQIKQGGKRRGANMGMLRVDHPDIVQFITCKDDGKTLQNFNLSVAFTHDFMDALEGKGGASNVSTYYEIRNPRTGDVERLESAPELWSQIVEHAWRTGDPGIVFIDRINDTSPFDISKYPHHRIEATNPCGEQPLEPFEACNLGSINLKNFVMGHDSVDYARLAYVTRCATCFLDDVVSSNVFPIPQITDQVNRNRKIGLGVMGWADMLIQLRIPYGSTMSLDLAQRVMSGIQAAAERESHDLATIRGTFPSWAESKFGEKSVLMRNATLTTIAPTGTISMLADCSSGIEPIFAFAFTKTVMDGTEFKYVHLGLQEALDGDDEVLQEILETGKLPAHIVDRYDYLVGAMDVSPEDHVYMQAAFQEHTDNAVSKTVNLPFEATAEDIDNIYKLAYATGCKGITIFRDGCREDQVLTVGTKKSDAQITDELLESLDSEQSKCESCPAMAHETRTRPEVLIGYTFKTDTPCGHLYVTMNVDDEGKPFEVFCKLGKSGACAGAVQETMGRLISQELRSGGDIERIIKQLRGASCGQQVGFGPKRVTSCIDAIGLVLQRYVDGEYTSQLVDDLGDVEQDPIDKPVDLPDLADGPGAKLADRPKPKSNHGACPECGGPVEHEGGCAVCRVCGFSKCA